MTGRHTFSFSRPGFRPSFANSLLPPRTEGAGKAGRRLRPHRRVQWVERNAHGFDRYSRDIPAFPAQWLYGLYVLSPGSGLSCPRCLLGLTSRRSARVAAPEPHDFAVRCRRFRPAERSPPDAAASIATRATLRDERVSSLMAARANGEYSSDLRNCQEAFLKNRRDAAKSVACTRVDWPRCPA